MGASVRGLTTYIEQQWVHFSWECISLIISTFKINTSYWHLYNVYITIIGFFKLAPYHHHWLKSFKMITLKPSYKNVRFAD